MQQPRLGNDFISPKLEATSEVQAKSGEGQAVFSWDKELTAAFPPDAKQYERNLHGDCFAIINSGIFSHSLHTFGYTCIKNNTRS